MAKATLALKNKPAPYIISAKALTGDTTTERFVSFANGEVTFNESPDANTYIITVLDSAGKSHSTTVSLDCTPQLAKCASGPTLLEVKNATKNGLMFVRQSSNVNVIRWRVFLGDIQVLQDTIENTFAELTVNFSKPLADGNYRLEIEGSSCKSGTSSLPFTVNTAAVPQAFLTGFPKAVKYDNGARSFIMSMVKGGSLMTTITNTDSNYQMVNTTFDYKEGEPFELTRDIFQDGNYTITVDGVTKEVVMGGGLPNCERGPFLLGFDSISRTQIQFNFDALRVDPLRVQILQGSNVIKDEIISPVNAHPVFPVNNLANGNYTMRLRGVACNSEWSAKDFAIQGAGLVINSATSRKLEGSYRVDVVFSGGSPNYRIVVKGANGDIIAQVGNVDDLQVTVALPTNTPAQNVSVVVTDAGGSTAQINGVVLIDEAGSVSPCGVFVNHYDKVFSYSSGNLVERINVANINFVMDMANTANKIFVLNRVETGTPRHVIKEYNITLSPFTQSFSKDYSINDPVQASGLCAASNTRLFICGDKVSRVDLNGSLATKTDMFSLPDGSVCTGDLMYDPVTKLFAITYEKNLSNHKIGIFEESGTLLRSASVPSGIYGMYQNDGITYMVKGDGITYKIDLNTLVYNQVGNLGTSIDGASQSPDCISIPRATNTNVTNRMIIMNTTGYGFAKDDPTGISPEWRDRAEAFRNMSYNGTNFSAIDAMGLNIRWCDYEPTQGVFNDTALIAAMNWNRSRGLKLAICFWDLRYLSDGFLATEEMSCGSRGPSDIWTLEGDKCSIAPYAVAGRAKFMNAVAHMNQILKQFGSDYVYMRYAKGETEEFYNGIIKSFANNMIRNVSLTGYSPVDKAAWVNYRNSRGLAGVEPVVPPNVEDAGATGDAWATAAGKAWYEFITDGLASLHAAFRDTVRANGGKSCAVFADAGGAQSAWYFTYRLNKIFAGCDIVYTSEGGTRWDLERKLFGADVIAGTFPSAEIAIEFDPEDIAENAQKKDYGDPTEGELLRRYASKGFERGVKYVHLSMAFSTGSDGRPNNINSLVPAFYNLKMNYINQSNIAKTPFVSVNFNLNTFKGDAGYWDLWRNNGGGESKQVKITLTGG